MKSIRLFVLVTSAAAAVTLSAAARAWPNVLKEDERARISCQQATTLIASLHKNFERDDCAQNIRSEIYWQCVIEKISQDHALDPFVALSVCERLDPVTK